jgi:hypothetical protein
MDKRHGGDCINLGIENVSHEFGHQEELYQGAY